MEKKKYTVFFDDGALPPSISWPTFEDGLPVLFGDATEDTPKVCRISFTKRGFYFDSSHRPGLRRYRYGETVKRPVRPEAVGGTDGAGAIAADVERMARAWRSEPDCFDAQEAAAKSVGEKTLGRALDAIVRRIKRLAERGGE